MTPPDKARHWSQSSVFYQIYPRSFCDTTGNGVGDLAGVLRHIDHLSWLGVDAVWLSPFYKSPMADYGYDVSDYRDVDALFGDLNLFTRLVSEFHRHGIRVVVDWVPNHTSKHHPWFQEARRDRDSSKRDWYIWRPGSPGQPPNNWRAAFPEGPAWTWDEASREWYLHLFTPDQPDLNWLHPAVRREMLDTLRFWLDLGVDGFRMDVVHLIGKDHDLADLPPDDAAHVVARYEGPHAHDCIREVRGVLDAYERQPVAIGEVVLDRVERLPPYTTPPDELHLVFNFSPLRLGWDAAAWRETIDATLVAFEDSWPTWVLSNHDIPRHRTRFGTDDRARAAAVLLLTLRGTPFVYAGEELGLEDAEIAPDKALDPAGFRDGCRAPIPWDVSATHGWATAEPWLPWPPHATSRNCASLRSQPESILHLYRDLLATRRTSPALMDGTQAWMPSPEDVLCYRRHHGDDERIVAINFAMAPSTVPIHNDWRIDVSSASERARGERWQGVLLPDEAVILSRA
jgi:alpha-glucosidase